MSLSSLLFLAVGENCRLSGPSVPHKGPALMKNLSDAALLRVSNGNPAPAERVLIGSALLEDMKAALAELDSRC